VRAVHHPPIHDVVLPEVLHALSDPLRLEIVCRLAEAEELPCGTLTAAVSKSTLSHHLKVLREAGVTATRASGTTRLVSLRRDELEGRFPGLLDRVLRAAREGRLSRSAL
jgi:DNA-binding transcriptional ArsR family regulator